VSNSVENNKLLPQAFIDKIANILPEQFNLQDFVDSCHQPLRRAIRVNTLKISVAEFKTRALEHHWVLTSIPWCEEGFWIELEEELTPLGNSFEHLSGLFYIQEASSMLPVSALFHLFEGNRDDNSGNSSSNYRQSTVLDAAAAPGSKTTQIASKMHNNGLIIANEFSSSRIKMLHANLQRCGIKNVALTHFDAKVFGSWLPDTFDAILLDAPCSGEGTIRKDKLAMKNWHQQAIDTISTVQKGLIESAFHALKENGILIYSTCTLNQEENQHICQHLVDTFPDSVEFIPLDNLFKGAEKTLTPEGFLHVWPQVYNSEGFFVAAIRKTEKSFPELAHKRLGKFPFIRPTRQKEAELYAYFDQQFGITDIEGMLYLRDKELWLFPDNIKPLINKIRFSRLGIKISEEFGNIRKGGFKTQHEFVTAFANQATKNIIELNAPQAKEYYQGKDIRGIETNGASGEVLVSYRGQIVGLGKALNNRLKNNLPREMIRDTNLFGV
jgi:16S rRNA (cytosine1407-C5)-methyltransferase